MTAQHPPPDLVTRAALYDLSARYAMAADDRDATAVGALFLPNGRLVTGRGQRTGRDEIVRAMAGLDRYEATHHQLGQAHYWIDEHGTHGELYCQAHHWTTEISPVSSADSGSGSEAVTTDWMLFVRYRDTYERTNEGWLIAERELVTVRSGTAPWR